MDSSKKLRWMYGFLDVLGLMFFLIGPLWIFAVDYFVPPQYTVFMKILGGLFAMYTVLSIFFKNLRDTTWFRMSAYMVYGLCTFVVFFIAALVVFKNPRHVALCATVSCIVVACISIYAVWWILKQEYPKADHKSEQFKTYCNRQRIIFWHFTFVGIVEGWSVLHFFSLVSFFSGLDSEVALLVKLSLGGAFVMLLISLFWRVQQNLRLAVLLEYHNDPEVLAIVREAKQNHVTIRKEEYSYSIERLVKNKAFTLVDTSAFAADDTITLYLSEETLRSFDDARRDATQQKSETRLRCRARNMDSEKRSRTSASELSNREKLLLLEARVKLLEAEEEIRAWKVRNAQVERKNKV